MAILNKDNNGYVTPEEFNLFAKQAQLELFEEYFYDYNKWVVKQNRRLANSGYTDIPKQLAEVIDLFTYESAALANVVNVFTLPTNWYTLNTVLYNSADGSLINKKVERVEQNKIYELISSHLTTPTTTYPAYVMNGATVSAPGNSITVYPATITTGEIAVQYVRYPLDPKWTYTTVSGSPVFNQSATDYQDFELPAVDQNDLVLKILQYAGINIRDMAVAKAAAEEEIITNQQES